MLLTVFAVPCTTLSTLIDVECMSWFRETMRRLSNHSPRRQSGSLSKFCYDHGSYGISFTWLEDKGIAGAGSQGNRPQRDHTVRYSVNMLKDKVPVDAAYAGKLKGATL